MSLVLQLTLAVSILNGILLIISLMLTFGIVSRNARDNVRTAVEQLEPLAIPNGKKLKPMLHDFNYRPYIPDTENISFTSYTRVALKQYESREVGSVPEEFLSDADVGQTETYRQSFKEQLMKVSQSVAARQFDEDIEELIERPEVNKDGLIVTIRSTDPVKVKRATDAVLYAIHEEVPTSMLEDNRDDETQEEEAIETETETG